MGRLGALFPKTLVARVYALYLTSLLAFLVTGLTLYYRTDFGQQIEDAHRLAETLMDVAASTVADSAVIGDYDSIKRTLQRSISRSHFSVAEFIDVGGATVRAEIPQTADLPPPAWITGLVEAHLYDVNRVVTVGGKDYGVLRMHFAAEVIAAEIWAHALATLGMSVVALLGGLVLIRIPLNRWLGGLDRMRAFEEDIVSGAIDARTLLVEDAPLELRQTFEVLNRTAASLQAQRVEATTTLNSIADAVITTSADDRIVFCNPAATRMFGVAAADLIGRRLDTLLPEATSGMDAPVEWTMKRIEIGGPQGRRQVLETTLSLIQGAGGGLMGHVLACRDVTEAHALDLKLRDELGRRERVLVALQGILAGLETGSNSLPACGASDDLESLSARVAFLLAEREASRRDLDNQKFALDQHAIVSVTDIGGRITYANDRFCNISGYTLDELLGANHRIVKSDEHPAELFAAMWQTITAGQVWRGEIKNRTKSGGHYWVSATIVPLTGTDGRIEQYIGIRTDITERKAIEEKLGEQLHLIETLLEAIPTPIYLKDMEGRYLRFNRAFGEAFGITRSDWIGKTVFDLVPGEMATLMDAKDRELLREGGMQSYEACFTHRASGVERDGIYWKARLTRPDGAVTGLVGTILDITDRKRFERELQDARLTAEAANRAKSDFLANMSHEIRTPMNGIIGMTELALDTALDPTQREYLTIVRGSAEALLVILNDILDFSKIEAGKLGIERIDFALPATISEALKAISARARKKGLTLVCDLPPELPSQVLGDPGRLRQLLTNFCDNAIKFTERGEITVRAGHRPMSGDTHEIEISVSDTGIGIPAGKLQHIFEAFAQADASTTRRYGGTGLGLTICARLVDMMGGRIRVDSEVGKGSTFSFSFLVGAGKPQSADLPPLTTWPGVRALVVDDHATNRRTLVHWLVTWGFAVDEASDGASALVQCRQGSANPYRVVLLDAHLPDTDGFAVAESLVVDGRATGTVLVMLTSGGERGDAQRCRELGIGAYLTKPATPLELREALTRSLEAGGQVGDGELLTRHRLREHQRVLQILLVEDHPVNQQLALAMLGKWGHRTTLAQNGKEAVESFYAARWDIVFMDMQMPIMGGLEATRLIRAAEEDEGAGRRVPIVAMTANAMAEDRQRCLDAGMDEHLAKPLDSGALHRLLAHVCVRTGTTEPAASFEAKAAVPAANATHADATVIEAVLDTVEPDIIAVVGAIFAEQIVLDIASATKARDLNDVETLKRLAHNMKASLATFGLTSLAEVARQVEAAPESVEPETLAELGAAIGRVAESVRKRLPGQGEVTTGIR
jgi:PAS domain S-box-containing protein